MTDSAIPTGKSIEGERFDKPLILSGQISSEPERYIAEKPYELTKYEFNIIRKRMTSELLFSLVSGATAGVVLSVLGKVISALIDKQSPSIERWEIWSVVAGLILSILFKLVRTKDYKERAQLEAVMEGHFQSNKPRRVHLTSSGDGQ
ncbi:MAG: hypothetical protein C0434_09710 [Xanthomonadaceae bacterium]|nr:hypothetical protein [Xanthomonadaceae bacterium]